MGVLVSLYYPNILQFSLKVAGWLWTENRIKHMDHLQTAKQNPQVSGHVSLCTNAKEREWKRRDVIILELWLLEDQGSHLGTSTQVRYIHRRVKCADRWDHSLRASRLPGRPRPIKHPLHPLRASLSNQEGNPKRMVLFPEIASKKCPPKSSLVTSQRERLLYFQIHSFCSRKL